MPSSHIIIKIVLVSHDLFDYTRTRLYGEWIGCQISLYGTRY